MLQKSGTHQLIYGKYLPLFATGFIHVGWLFGISEPSTVTFLYGLGSPWGFITIIGPGWEGLGSLRPAPVWVWVLFRGEKIYTTDIWWCIVRVCLFGVAFCLWSSTIYISVSLKELKLKTDCRCVGKKCVQQENGCNVLLVRMNSCLRDPRSKQKAACAKPLVAECLITGSRSANRTCVQWCLS